MARPPLAAILLCSAVVHPGAQAESPARGALDAMVAAERAFAAAAREKGIRDAFLEFFADDAMFDPAAGRAKDQLRRQKPQPFNERELVWEPRTGDVAASGELGWLTGPGTFVDRLAADPSPRYTNYLSVWRRGEDGRWRVYLDVGTRLTAPAAFAPGFVRFPFGARYVASSGEAGAAKAGSDALTLADRAFNARIGAAGPATAYAETLAPGARVHRDGAGALTDPAAVREWLTAHAAGLTAATTAAESAASGDLGYSYGTHRLAGPPSATGSYVRVWTRAATGRWLVVADVVLAPR